MSQPSVTRYKSTNQKIIIRTVYESCIIKCECIERKVRVSFCLKISTFFNFQIKLFHTLYRENYSETGYDLSEAIRQKLLVLIEVKFVLKIFRKIWNACLQ